LTLTGRISLRLVGRRHGLILLSLALAVCYWLMESAIHAYIFLTGSFVDSMLPVDANEIWMRLIVVTTFLGFGLFAQSTLSHRIKMEVALQQRQQLLGRTEAELAEALHIARLGSWSHDLGSGELTWSDEHFRLFGLQPGEITLSFEVFLDYVHPEDRQAVRQAVDTAIRGEQAYHIDFRIVRRDGEVRILHSHAAVNLDASNQPESMIGTTQDVSEIRKAQALLQAERDQLSDSADSEEDKLLKANQALHVEILERIQMVRQLQESEERFRQLAENIDEVFWMTETDKNTMLYISPAYERIWGRSCASLYQSPRNWVAAIHADDRQRVLEAVTTRQVSGEYDEQYRIVRPDGSLRWIRDRAFPIRHASGHVYRVVGTAEDISQRKQAEQMERLHMQELAHKSKLENVGRMAAEIAHELHQPLSAIRTYCDTCQRMLTVGQSVPDLLPEILQKVSAQAERAGKVVHSVHDFSSKGEVHLLSQNMNDIIRSAMDLIHLEDKCADIRIRQQFDETIFPVFADRILIEQVLLNLLRNACEAMLCLKPEDRLLTIWTGMADDRFVEVSMHDNGKQLSADELKHLFDAFYTTRKSGMGLGLTLCRLIVENHHGQIWAEQDDDGGTLLRFTLPVAREIEA